MSDPLKQCTTLDHLNTLLIDVAPKLSTNGGRKVTLKNTPYTMNQVTSKFVELIQSESFENLSKNGTAIATRIKQIDANDQFKDKLSAFQKIRLKIHQIVGNILAKFKHGPAFSREVPHLQEQIKKALHKKYEELKAGANGDPVKLNDMEGNFKSVEKEIDEKFNALKENLASQKRQERVQQTLAKRIAKLRKGAEAQDPAAQFSLWLLHMTHFIKVTPEEVKEWEKGFKEKHYFKWVPLPSSFNGLVEDAKNHDETAIGTLKALEKLKNDAKNGNEESIVALSIQCNPTDETELKNEAFNLLKKAAEKPGAHLAKTWLFMQKSSIEKSESEAIEKATQISELGGSIGNLFLAMIYLRGGDTIAKDSAKANEYISRLAANDQHEMLKKLLEMIPNEFLTTQSGLDWAEKQAKASTDLKLKNDVSRALNEHYSQAKDSPEFKSKKIDLLKLQFEESGEKEILDSLIKNSIKPEDLLPWLNSQKAKHPVNILMTIGKIYLIKGDLEQAKEHFLNAVRQEPQHILNVFYLYKDNNYGFGLVGDEAKGVEWLESCAKEMNSVIRQKALGILITEFSNQDIYLFKVINWVISLYDIEKNDQFRDRQLDLLIQKISPDKEGEAIPVLERAAKVGHLGSIKKLIAIFDMQKDAQKKLEWTTILGEQTKLT